MMKKLLLPFSGIYWLGTSTRNLLYNWKIKRSTGFDLPIILVGNLSTGGTGKSPHVIHLLELLKDQYKTATLSRGYGRLTKGYKYANYEATAETIGDEPLQFFTRFKNKIIVTVCEDRVEGVKKNIQNFKPHLILLDDAYQHRAVKAGFSILLTKFDELYVDDYLLPAGNLRESVAGAARADIIVVTKCPEDLDENQKQIIAQKIKPKNYQKLFFSKVIYDTHFYGKRGALNANSIGDCSILLISGIANPTDFEQYIQAKFSTVECMRFPDHHNFSPSDVEKIYETYQKMTGNRLILTTEKDYMRLQRENRLMDNLYYLPITVAIENTEIFNETILDYVRKNSTNSRLS